MRVRKFNSNSKKRHTPALNAAAALAENLRSLRSEGKTYRRIAKIVQKPTTQVYRTVKANGVPPVQVRLGCPPKLSDKHAKRVNASRGRPAADGHRAGDTRPHTVVRADVDRATLRSLALAATNRHTATSTRARPSTLQQNARPGDGQRRAAHHIDADCAFTAVAAPNARSSARNSAPAGRHVDGYALHDSLAFVDTTTSPLVDAPMPLVTATEPPIELTQLQKCCTKYTVVSV